MSKAFTKESDDVAEQPALPRRVSSLPPGAKNYLTPAGERRLRKELNRLIQEERPRLASRGDDPNAKRQLQSLDQRVYQIQESLRSAVTVPAPVGPRDTVLFGATVTVRDSVGDESQYRIVGADETDIDRGWVSWLSPIAKALLNAHTAERVRFKFPSGEEQLEIVSVSYDSEESD